MLFRIYDVIFAEGASETIMRVALSLMRKNEDKILACAEFEDVMQLLLSRGLWDCYHYNADAFVNDFVSLTTVTHESLQALELSYKEPHTVDTVGPSETVGSTASRFLGRLWAGSNSNTKSVNLSPGLTAPSRPVSFLRRSPSKQSIASTLNSMEGGASESMTSSSTDVTSIFRDSSNTDGSSIRGQSVSFNGGNSLSPKSNKDKNLHGQIEDLLTALSEMQRDHATLATQLQMEREQREEDREAVKSLLSVLRTTGSLATVNSSSNDLKLDEAAPSKVDTEEDNVQRDQTALIRESTSELDSSLLSVESTSTNDGASPLPAVGEPLTTASAELPDESVLSALLNRVEDASKLLPMSEEDFSALLDKVESRFGGKTNKRASMVQSKVQLREELVRSKEQLANEVSKTQDYNRRLTEMEQEVNNLKDEVKEGHNHLRSAHQEKQRLERTIHDLRTKKTPTTPETKDRPEPDWRASTHGAGGLRELKLGRANSTKSGPPAFAKRTSSLNTAAMTINMGMLPQSQNERPVSFSAPSSAVSPTKDADMDALVLELVQAKTAEAQAKQEAEEAKGKLEGMKKLLGLNHGVENSLGHKSSPSQPNLLQRNHAIPTGAGTKAESAAPLSAVVGNFWGGWGKKA